MGRKHEAQEPLPHFIRASLISLQIAAGKGLLVVPITTNFSIKWIKEQTNWFHHISGAFWATVDR